MALKVKADMHVYEMTVRLPPEDCTRDARDKIDLLTTIFLSEVEDVPEWRVIEADFDQGCIRALIRASRFRGVRSGRVIVELIRRDDKEDIR